MKEQTPTYGHCKHGRSMITCGECNTSTINPIELDEDTRNKVNEIMGKEQTPIEELREHLMFCEANFTESEISNDKMTSLYNALNVLQAQHKAELKEAVIETFKEFNRVLYLPELLQELAEQYYTTKHETE